MALPSAPYKGVSPIHTLQYIFASQPDHSALSRHSPLHCPPFHLLHPAGGRSSYPFAFPHFTCTLLPGLEITLADHRGCSWALPRYGHSCPISGM